MLKEKLVPQLLKDAQNGLNRFFIQFGGQGSFFLTELKRLNQNHPELKEYFAVIYDAIYKFTNRYDYKQNEKKIYEHGFDLKKWIETDDFPSEEYLSRCTISFSGNQIAQYAYLYLFTKAGYSISDLIKYSVACTGHSQGLQSVLAIAVGKPDGELLSVFDELVTWFLFAGYVVQMEYGVPVLSNDVLNQSKEMGDFDPTPMVSVGGMHSNQIYELIEEFNKTVESEIKICLSLKNTDQLNVISGSAIDLFRFRKKHFQLFKDNKFSWSYLSVSAPFHNPTFGKIAVKNFCDDNINKNFKYRGKDLKLPVISFVDAQNLQEIDDVSHELAEIMLRKPLVWEKALTPLFNDPSITHVIDFGPGKISSIFTRTLLKEKNISVLSIVGKAGWNKLMKTE